MIIHSVFINCKFISSQDIKLRQAGNQLNCVSCEFEKVFPYLKPLDVNNKINMSSTFDYSVPTISEKEFAYIYSNNTLISRPSLSTTFPLEKISDYEWRTRRDLTDNTPISLIPTNSVLRQSSKYLLITIGSSGTTRLYNGGGFTNYYYNVLTTDSSGNITIGATTTIGNPTTGGYNLTIDNSNNTVTKAGTYATKCDQWLLPYYYKDYLPVFS